MIEGECWNCKRMNEVQADGYCLCICRDICGTGMWYHPKEEVRRKGQDKLFLNNNDIK